MVADVVVDDVVAPLLILLALLLSTPLWVPLWVVLVALLLSTSAEFLVVESESDVGCRLCELDGEFECVDEGSRMFEAEIPVEEEEEEEDG